LFLREASVPETKMPACAGICVVAERGTAFLRRPRHTRSLLRAHPNSPPPSGLFLANYRECGHALDLDLVTRPELLERDDCAALSAGWYWWAFGLGKLADAGKFDEITRRINGPAMEGAEPRRARWAVAKQALGA
jgi:hypothetical protein